MRVLETEVVAEREHSTTVSNDRREQHFLPVGEDGDIAIAAIEALGNLLQVGPHMHMRTIVAMNFAALSCIHTYCCGSRCTTRMPMRRATRMTTL